MKIYVVIASINELHNIVQFKESFLSSIHETKLIVIDEGNETLRSKNRELLETLNCVFYGPKERVSWFQSRFGGGYKKYMDVIPERCHAETSFGFLVAYEEGADVIVELDDDVFSVNGYDLLKSHLHNLLKNEGVKVSSKHKWYNTIENIMLNKYYHGVFPRGHPYSPEARLEDYIWENNGAKCVLNMGLWTGHPDLDALTILYHGGLDGRCNISSKNLRREKVIIAEGTYFAVCSMNTSFFSRIIPAFYQLYMNYMGVDRFDDIWSGIFLKKIADHLGDKVCLGKPLIYHDKRARNVFKDLRSEVEGMIINEVLWRIVDKVNLTGRDYYECYSELADEIERHLDEFTEKLHRDFIKLQTKKMKLWLDIVERIR
ncbi:MAG: hypothetical protein QXJ62_05475 [Nitrososphaeria archaeon]